MLLTATLGCSHTIRSAAESLLHRTALLACLLLPSPTQEWLLSSVLQHHRLSCSSQGFAQELHFLLPALT